MTPKQLRAVIYARYSTKRQRERSIEDQWRECTRAAEREGFKIVEKFGDKEMSGGTANRPGYQAMLAAARRHDFEILITEDIDRLWRNRAEFGPRSAELEDLGIHWFSCVGDDTRRDGWGPLIQLKLAMAEHERKKKASYRTRRSQEGKALKGEYTGGKSYGYAAAVGADGKKIRVIDAKQAKVVLQIYNWRADGWSAQRIARHLNETRVASPGSTWARIDTGPRRKTKGGWRPSAIAGDVNKGTGILNNALYAGKVIWGRSKWTRSAANSDVRTVTQVEQAQWIVTEQAKLRIVPDELWNKVRAIQTARNARREAVRRGVLKGRNGTVKHVGSRDSKYWLGTLLVCAECGSNLIGDGRTDYVCPAFTSNNCANDLRLRREAAHAAVFDLLQHELLSDKRVAEAKAYAELVLRERIREEEQATRDAVRGVDVRRLDDEIKQLHKMPLRPAALAAAIAEIERERTELKAKAAGKRDQREGRARQLLAQMPEIARRYLNQMAQARKGLVVPRIVHDARETTRRLLVDGRITLAPTADRTAVAAPVRLVGLGEHVLQLAGIQRRPPRGSESPVSWSASGGVICAVTAIPQSARLK